MNSELSDQADADAEPQAQLDGVISSLTQDLQRNKITEMTIIRDDAFLKTLFRRELLNTKLNHLRKLFLKFLRSFPQ